MPRPDKLPLLRLSMLLSQVLPQSRAESVLLQLVQPEDYLCLLAQRSSDQIELSPQEFETLKAFKLPKRRSQWLTGRLCAKQAVVGYCRKYLPHLPEFYQTHIHIRNASTGRPELDGKQLPPALHGLDISISHSGDYAIALASSAPCGIDIQQRSETLTRVRDRFCLKEEEVILQRQLPTLDSLWQLTLLWAAKEAAKKALSCHEMPGFLQFILTDIGEIKSSAFIFYFQHDRQGLLPLVALRIAVTHFDDYALAICLPEEDSLA